MKTAFIIFLFLFSARQVHADGGIIGKMKQVLQKVQDSDQTTPRQESFGAAQEAVFNDWTDEDRSALKGWYPKATDEDLKRYEQMVKDFLRDPKKRTFLDAIDAGTMDAAACRRAAVESLSENLTDGFTSALFWYVLGGLPALVLFKVVSTMDSMVGYRTPRYAEFGWCGARLDDAMNYIPARLTWLLIAAVATVLPGDSGRKALVVGLRQHAVLPGPNSGWSEAATAGAIQRRLVGPIHVRRRLVTDMWLGDAVDPPVGTHDDVIRAVTAVTAAGALGAALAIGALLVVTSSLP